MKKTHEKFRERIEKKIEVEFTQPKRKPNGDFKEKDVRVGEFWRYYEGMNLGNEISKDNLFKRPCIVLHNDFGNSLILVAPISTKHRLHLGDYYLKINDYDVLGLKESRIIINQIRLIDKKRFSNRIQINRQVSLAHTSLKKYISILKKCLDISIEGGGDTESQKIESPQPLQIV